MHLLHFNDCRLLLQLFFPSSAKRRLPHSPGGMVHVVHLYRPFYTSRYEAWFLFSQVRKAIMNHNQDALQKKHVSLASEYRTVEKRVRLIGLTVKKNIHIRGNIFSILKVMLVLLLRFTDFQQPLYPNYDHNGSRAYSKNTQREAGIHPGHQSISELHPEVPLRKQPFILQVINPPTGMILGGDQKAWAQVQHNSGSKERLDNPLYHHAHVFLCIFKYFFLDRSKVI